MLAFVLAGIFALRQVEMPALARGLLLVSWIAIGMYADAATIKLVPAMKARAAARLGRKRQRP